jgi:phage baseplate assembly protein W
MARPNQFKGFSTQVAGRRSWTLTDTDLIKQDLLNHFNTRKGERLMLPTYGTIIWDMLFEPFTEDVKDDIVQDVKRVVASEPRVKLEKVVVSSSVHGITVALQLRFKPFDMVGSLAVSFDRRSLEN